MKRTILFDYSEKYLEEYLCKEIRLRGGECIKLGKQKGIPDRMCLLPNGKVLFIELKSKGEKPRALQNYWIDRLIRLGYRAVWIDSKEQINRLLDETEV